MQYVIFLYLPRQPAVEVIKTDWSVCLSVCGHSQGWTDWCTVHAEVSWVCMRKITKYALQIDSACGRCSNTFVFFTLFLPPSFTLKVMERLLSVRRVWKNETRKVHHRRGFSFWIIPSPEGYILWRPTLGLEFGYRLSGFVLDKGIYHCHKSRGCKPL